MDRDIEEQLKAIPKGLPQIVPGSEEFRALTSPEATADPVEMLGKVAKYNEEVKWYNDHADEHDGRLKEYQQNATDPSKSSSALETYATVRIGTEETTGLALSLDDVNAAYRDIRGLIKPDRDVPAVRDIARTLVQAGVDFEHSQSALQRLENQVSLEQARLKEFRALQRIADGHKPELMEQLSKLNAFGDLKKPLSVDDFKSQTNHRVIGRDSRLKGIDVALRDLDDQLTKLEKLVKENPGKLQQFTQDLVNPNGSKEYRAYLQGLEQQHTLTEKAWNELRDVVATQDQSGKVSRLDKPAIKNLYDTLSPVGRESFIEFPETLKDAKRMVEGLNETIAAERAQEVRAQRGRDVRAVVQAPAARNRAAGVRGQEELDLIADYESPATPTRRRQMSDTSASIRIGMSLSGVQAPQQRAPSEQLRSRFSADSSDAGVDPDAKLTRTYSSSSDSSDQSRKAKRPGHTR
jgi:hypothetical protein